MSRRDVEARPKSFRKSALAYTLIAPWFRAMHVRFNYRRVSHGSSFLLLHPDPQIAFEISPRKSRTRRTLAFSRRPGDTSSHLIFNIRIQGCSNVRLIFSVYLPPLHACTINSFSSNRKSRKLVEGESHLKKKIRDANPRYPENTLN